MSAIESKDHQTEGAWINEIKANNDKTLERLYTANYPKVEKYVLLNSGSEEDAKDIYQDAFIATWRNIMLGKFTSLQKGSVSGYLLQVAKNKWIDVLRERKRKPMISDRKPETEPFEALASEEEEYLELAREHFTRMGEPCKEVLIRFYFKRERLREIASHFSWTEASAKNNKYRCLQKLRVAIANSK
jgi:RNA polymerase sigma factor (sigma-70 family)